MQIFLCFIIKQFGAHSISQPMIKAFVFMLIIYKTLEENQIYMIIPSHLARIEE